MISRPDGVPQTLAECREELDRVDCDLIRLMKRRIDLGLEAAVMKRKAGMPIVDPEREEDVITQARAWASQSGLPESEVAEIFLRVVSLSRNAQLNTHRDSDSNET